VRIHCGIRAVTAAGWRVRGQAGSSGEITKPDTMRGNISHHFIQMSNTPLDIYRGLMYLLSESVNGSDSEKTDSITRKKQLKSYLDPWHPHLPPQTSTSY
jgi:hypothetical protein